MKSNKSVEVFIYHLTASIDNKHPCNIVVISPTKHLQAGLIVNYIHQDVRSWLPKKEISGRIVESEGNMLCIDTVH